MTAAEAAALVGTVVALRTETTLAIHASVLDVKQSYGILRYLIAPVAGTGQAWVFASRSPGQRD